MPRERLSVTVRGEIIEKMEKDRGLISMSRYVDALLAIAYGIDKPEVLESLPDYLEKCVRAKEAQASSNHD